MLSVYYKAFTLLRSYCFLGFLPDFISSNNKPTHINVNRVIHEHIHPSPRFTNCEHFSMFILSLYINTYFILLIYLKVNLQILLLYPKIFHHVCSKPIVLHSLTIIIIFKEINVCIIILPNIEFTSECSQISP